LTEFEELHDRSLPTNRDTAVTTDRRRNAEAVLAEVDAWGADHASAALLERDGVIATQGDLDHRYRWASVTKLVTAFAVLIAAERGLLALDEPAGPPGSTVRPLGRDRIGLYPRPQRRHRTRTAP
jgi:CubicO group peptidase (beta-lactamase class C family)